MVTVIPGFLTCLTLIVAIGAQNVLVLRQGIRREHVGVVVAICATSDAVLMLGGVAGLGRLVETAPWLVDAARLSGATFLLGYAALSARRAWVGGGGLEVGEERGETGGRQGSGGTVVATSTRLAPVVAATLAITWLNPHVYLDSVFLVGSVASSYGDDRWWFAVGAVTASLVWFSALGFGARHLGRWLRTAAAWRVLDGLIAVTMVGIAAMLLRG